MPDALLPSSQQRVTSLGNIGNVLALLAICVALGLAFYYQLALAELPCPLCLLQRAGLILCGIGFLLNVRFGVRATYYGVALAGALATGVIALRQVLLHVMPGDAGYGSTLFGLHFYTWAALGALAAAAGIALLLLVLGGEKPARQAAWHGPAGKPVAWLFILLVAGNLVSTVLECGNGACPDNPVSYLLLDR